MSQRAAVIAEIIVVIVIVDAAILVMTGLAAFVAVQRAGFTLRAVIIIMAQSTAQVAAVVFPGIGCYARSADHFGVTKLQAVFAVIGVFEVQRSLPHRRNHAALSHQMKGDQRIIRNSAFHLNKHLARISAQRADHQRAAGLIRTCQHKIIPPRHIAHELNLKNAVAFILHAFNIGQFIGKTHRFRKTGR